MFPLYDLNIFSSIYAKEQELLYCNEEGTHIFINLVFYLCKTVGVMVMHTSAFFA